MKTDELRITQTPEEIENTLDKIESIAMYTGMPRRDATSMRLLAEEIISATKGILEAYEGRLWMETNDEQFSLHIRVAKPTSKADRDKLVALSKNGGVTPPKGLFSRLGAVMEKYLLLDDDDLEESVFSGYAIYATDMFGMPSTGTSIYHYFPPVEHAPQKPEEPADELYGIEKSIIDAIVDDIQVTVQSGKMEIIAIKNLNQDRKEATL